MIEQGNKFLDVLIQYMAEFFEVKIENLEKLIPPSIPSRYKKKSKKRKAVALEDSGGEDSEEETKRKQFCKHHGMCGHTTDKNNTHKALIKQKKLMRVTYNRKEKENTNQEVNVVVKRKVKKARKKKKKKQTEELYAFEIPIRYLLAAVTAKKVKFKMCSGKLFNMNHNDSRIIVKQHK